jgi:hypothetical protein
MKYFIYINSEKILFKSTNPSFISPTIKKIFIKKSIDIFKYLDKLGLNVQKCAICKSAYNPYFTLEFNILEDGEVKITNIRNGHKSYGYQKYNKNYCYASNPNCPGIKMNPNSIEFISLTLNLTKDQAIDYIHSHNKSPFYLNNHLTKEEYSKFQSRSIDFFIKHHGKKKGTEKYNQFCTNQKYSTSKNFYIDKFGLDEGQRLWDEISKKKAITLANMTELYGEELGKLKLSNWKATISKSNSKYIQEFGLENGLKKIENRNAKRLATLMEHGKIIIPADQKVDYLIYHHLVLEETKYQLLIYGHLKFGENWQKTKKEKKLEIDHQFSIKSGFINGISPNVIGNIENLELITRTENIKKRDNNSISHEILIKKIVNSKYGK